MDKYNTEEHVQAYLDSGAELLELEHKVRISLSDRVTDRELLKKFIDKFNEIDKYYYNPEDNKVPDKFKDTDSRPRFILDIDIKNGYSIIDYFHGDYIKLINFLINITDLISRTNCSYDPGDLILSSFISVYKYYYTGYDYCVRNFIDTLLINSNITRSVHLGIFLDPLDERVDELNIFKKYMLDFIERNKDLSDHTLDCIRDMCIRVPDFFIVGERPYMEEIINDLGNVFINLYRGVGRDQQSYSHFIEDCAAFGKDWGRQLMPTVVKAKIKNGTSYFFYSSLLGLGIATPDELSNIFDDSHIPETEKIKIFEECYQRNPVIYREISESYVRHKKRVVGLVKA